ncbi:aldehyde dehydrogenase family protein [Luteolibacter sp. AS25]|uniref:aldehyde dehydrogenase family protein n=1 Tax=Luteolibacter sp. AS25 TaxID=3135776 RepID=UPI00398AAB4B
MSAKTKKVEVKKAVARELLFGDLWDFDPAPESAPAGISERYGLFIGGEFVEPRSGEWFDSISPRNEEKISEIALANDADVDAAYSAAGKAFPAWSKLAGAERGKYLYRLARLLQDRAREFAVAETLDGGKPIKEARDFDVPMAAAHFFYHAGWADKLEYAAPGRDLKPLGVVGQVIPWNFPLLMLAWKLAPALALGNTVVLKPSETTSVTALKFAELIRDAGLPKGVVNIVTGAGDTGAAIVRHPAAAKIAFTGSTGVGKWIQRELAGTGKRLTLELGGKGANIIFEDAAIDQAVEGIINGIFFNQGHVCCAGSRLLVQESIEAEVMKKLKLRMKSLRVGDPLDKNTDIGAINSKAQLGRISEMVENGVAEGAEMYQPECKLPKKGFYFAPTLMGGVSQSHSVVKDEIFGPVLSILNFRTPEEAVEKANNTSYGLSAGVWTDKGSKYLQIATQLKSGVVWGNSFNKFDPTSPFGGFKQSGFGREGGRQGLLEYGELV